MMQWHPFAGGGVSCAVGGGGFGCDCSEVGLRNSPGDAGGARSADFGVSGPGDSTSIGTADSKSAAWSAAASSKLSSVRDGAWISENVRAEPHSAAAAVVGRPCVPDNVNGSPATDVTGRRIISGDEGADAATGTSDTLPPDDVGGRTRTAPAGSDLRLSRC